MSSLWPRAAQNAYRPKRVHVIEATMSEPLEACSSTRRQVLALAAGLALGPLTARLAAAQAAPIMTRSIPATGERLPVVGLGTAWKYATNQPFQHDEMTGVVQALVAGGGSVVDTASVYGAAERLLGQVLGETGLRAKIFISTKLEKDQLTTEALQGSLRRLGVSKIDLMQVHNVNSSGLSLGISTSTTRDFDAVEAVMRRERPDFLELNYWLGDRTAEQRLLPTAAELGIATLIDRPFGGFEDPGGNLWRTVLGKPLPDWARDFDAASWAQLFLKYLVGNGAVTVVIPGTDKAEHMTDNLGAGRGRLPDAAQRQRITQFIDRLA
jgi:diketogulonate reductase-like aldo/keto reductase